MMVKFKKELIRQLRVAIAAAIGFVIAFSWRNFVFELTKNWVKAISTMTNTNFINFTSSMLITIIGVILIIISSKILE
ncbi:hypothetical protein COV15_01265 [Candidatus Woesearchaeota archaeon CG10_big_fil_rev_8_21_14_0_10_34_12]|nr:MAG: hypothetical protein COV15_01265 [Candidatus Woesearchaeota archaeon CG10_big_fil_rev_8_21_14_0_10_34_12]